jgi:hypothetical protein
VKKSSYKKPTVACVGGFEPNSQLKKTADLGEFEPNFADNRFGGFSPNSQLCVLADLSQTRGQQLLWIQPKHGS